MPTAKATAPTDRRPPSQPGGTAGDQGERPGYDADSGRWRSESIVNAPSISGPETPGAARSDAARVHPRDLVALLALPLLWKEKHPDQIARGLLEVIDSLLQPDCAYVRDERRG